MRQTYDVVAVAGYHDTTWHIKAATLGWRLRYGLRVHSYRFGTTNKPEDYPKLWQNFETFLAGLGKAAVIGTSFGATIADRAIIEHPDQVPCIVDISGPHRLNDLNPTTVKTRYPMLGYSLSAYDARELPLDHVMTIRPLEDPVINPENVRLEGAANLEVPLRSHGPGIFAGLALRQNEIAAFIRSNMEQAA